MPLWPRRRRQTDICPLLHAPSTTGASSIQHDEGVVHTLRRAYVGRRGAQPIKKRSFSHGRSTKSGDVACALTESPYDRPTSVRPCTSPRRRGRRRYSTTRASCIRCRRGAQPIKKRPFSHDRSTKSGDVACSALAEGPYDRPNVLPFSYAPSTTGASSIQHDGGVVHTGRRAHTAS